jgi:hypothetical protein
LKRPLFERLAMGAIAGVVAFGLAYLARPRTWRNPRARAAMTLETPLATFELHAGAAQITVRSRDRALTRDVDLALVVDGTVRPFAIAREDVHQGLDALRVSIPVSLDQSVADLTLELREDRARDALLISVEGDPGAGAAHEVSLRADLGSEGDVVFVAGVGQVADRTTASGTAVLFDASPRPLALMSARGPVAVDAVPENTSLPVEPIRLSVTAPPTGPGGRDDARSSSRGRRVADLALVVGDSSMAIWRSLAELAGTPTARVRGHVTGADLSSAPSTRPAALSEPSIVFGRDAEGHPAVRARVDPSGSFVLDVPPSVVEWYASVDPGRSSGLASFVPGTPHDLVLDVSPGGDLHVVIVDADTRAPLTARLLVHGVDGTIDPSFGPDYRASGAGPVIDALRGDVTTPLPSGRYRIGATKGIEWSVDAKVVDIRPGRVTDVELAPRHVVRTPGALGCDLHVHARPSFDTPVTPEDRVVSLVAAGIDFAVPTEHNIVGDYTSSIATLELAEQLSSVPGIEVTTYGKGFGHFGVFPYPPSAPVPPYKHTNMAAMIRAIRTGDPSRFFQLNHPRLPKGIGYFNVIGFDPKGPKSQLRSRIDFDGIEVFNGYDAEFPDRVEQVLRDYWALLDYGWRYAATGSSDSHRIQFHWAGYPRTLVTVDPHAAADGDPKSVDPLVVVANVKKGHAVITSGPVIDFELAGARPGDEAQTPDNPVRGHVRVRAAPWIDVTQVEVVVGEIGGSYRIAQTFSVPSRPTAVGPEAGSLEEAEARTLRFDKDLEVSISPAGSAEGADANGWVMILARGERRMDDVLPFMPCPPFAFTNPIYVVRHPVAPPPFPGAPAARPPSP